MDPLRVNALGAAALPALKAVPPPAALATQDTPVAQASTPLGVQDLATGLARDLLQRALPASTLFPVAEPQPPGSTLALSAAASLLAALTAPQAPADTSSTAPAGTAPTQAAAPAQATPATDATAAANTATAAVADLGTEVPGVPDATSLDFALETALRFGAGVGALGAPLLQTPNLDAGLVRDATAVLRQGSLQPQAGGPGPEAFARPQALPHLAAQRALQSYQPPPATAASGQLDLLA